MCCVCVYVLSLNAAVSAVQRPAQYRNPSVALCDRLYIYHRHSFQMVEAVDEELLVVSRVSHIHKRKHMKDRQTDRQRQTQRETETETQRERQTHTQ